MVKIHLKQGEESLFLYETVTYQVISELIEKLTEIYNLRAKIHYLCQEVDDLANHGVTLPLDLRGLDEEKITGEESSDKHEPEGGYAMIKDPIQKRCGKAPKGDMKDILLKCVEDAKIKISNKQIENNVCLTKEYLEDVLENFKQVVSVVYTNGLPSHDPIYEIFQNNEETTNNFESLNPKNVQLWWASKELDAEKKLSDYIGKNEKTKIIAKIQKKGNGPPPRESAVSEEEKKKLMLLYYKRQEELKKLEDDDEDSYLDQKWASNQQLKCSFLGLKDVQFKPQ